MNLRITEFESRKNSQGELVELTWEELKEKLREPVYTNDLFEEYVASSNEDKTSIKDVGGYVGGTFKGDKRAKSGLIDRCLIVIDADNATLDAISIYNKSKPAAIEPYYFCHTTHSSTKDEPRLRWLFPLSRPVSADEYKILSAIVATWVGEDTIDETTDQPERLMFWPSVSLDADYLYYEGGIGCLDPDNWIAFEVPKSPDIASFNDEIVVEEELTEIPEGQRNRTVFSFAASLRGQGLGKSMIRRMLDDYNEEYCNPPLPSFELDTIVRSVCDRYKPGAPVMATLRTAYEDFKDLGTWNDEKEGKTSEIKMESFASLASRDIAPPVYVVEGLITTGTTVLASPPKFGKSWMCLDMALSVATGTTFFGMNTSQCGVLYLALEDGDYRLKDRGLKVAGSRGIPDNLYLVEEAPTLDNGLLPKLYDALNTCKHKIGMIIIDTLQKIRGPSGRTEGVYGYDYRELSALHNFALRNNIAVVLVHHLNKGGDDSDFVSRLNGSTGVSGAADTIITLTRNKREDSETKMSVTGRDVKARTLVAMFDRGTYRWTCLGEERDVEAAKEESEFRTHPLVRTIMFRLDESMDLDDVDISEAKFSSSSTDLVNDVKKLYGKEYETPEALSRDLKKLEDKLYSEYGITLERKKSNNKRSFVFTRPID